MYKDLSLKEKAKVIKEGVRLGLNSIDDILSLYDEAISYLQESPIVSPYGQWKYPGRDTIIPSNNITMDNVNYPVLGISDTGDTKVMMPWNDYKFRGSMVYEHPLISNQFQLGGNTKPTFDLWYPTVPNQKNDTSSYDLRRAYNTLPFDEMEKFRTIDDYHLPSVAYDEKTDTYTFLKRNGHPTLNYELDWYNSGSPDALEFKERYKLDTLSLPWRYIPNTFLIGGLVKKPEPIYNENGQVIGRRYVNKENSKIIDSVVPQGRVNFQEFLKAKGKKARATNFEDLELFLDSLIARGYNEPLRLAFLATSYNEMDNKGAASKGIGGNGYMGFNTIRMPLNLLNDSSKQIQYILDDTEKLTPDNWTDGGSGGPYIKNLTDAFNKFWNETNPNAATLILNKANIRPAKLSDWYLRASDADLMKQYMEYPELPKEEEQKQKKNNKLLDSFVDFILSGGLQNTPSYSDGGNLFKKGGIYIKPENRGKFTALKKRTGHSASWFKAHGTPALKKMATFALNARHWKHDEGGHLFLGDDSYLLTLFDKYGPKALVIEIDKPVTLPEVLVVADAPKPGDRNYDKYIANTYDAWQRRDLFTPNGDIDINTLPTETRNRVRGYSGTIAALKGMNKAGEKLFPYIMGIAGGPTGLLAGAASIGASLLVDSSVNNLTQGENESWGDWVSDKLGILNPYGRLGMELTNPAFWPGYIYGGVNAFNKAANSKTIGTLRIANLMKRDLNNKSRLNSVLDGLDYSRINSYRNSMIGDNYYHGTFAKPYQEVWKASSNMPVGSGPTGGNGIFVSYGQPWSERINARTMYIFPENTFGRRLATDYRGNIRPNEYINNIGLYVSDYDAGRRIYNIHNIHNNPRLSPESFRQADYDYTTLSGREESFGKYGNLKLDHAKDIYTGNQTVIPKSEFDLARTTKPYRIHYAEGPKSALIEYNPNLGDRFKLSFTEDDYSKFIDDWIDGKTTMFTNQKIAPTQQSYSIMSGSNPYKTDDNQRLFDVFKEMERQAKVDYIFTGLEPTINKVSGRNLYEMPVEGVDFYKQPITQQTKDIFEKLVFPRLFSNPLRAEEFDFLYNYGTELAKKQMMQDVFSQKQIMVKPKLYESLETEVGKTVGVNHEGKGVMIKDIPGNLEYAEGHELRHTTLSVIPRTKSEEKILSEAYKDVPNPYEHDYDMSKEWETMNFDARKAVLGEVHGKSSVETQNKIIEKMSDAQIVDRVYKSDGYWRHYIDDLIDKSGIDGPRDFVLDEMLKMPEFQLKIKSWKNAMMKVGAVSGVIAGVSNNKNKK